MENSHFVKVCDHQSVFESPHDFVQEKFRILATTSGFRAELLNEFRTNLVGISDKISKYIFSATELCDVLSETLKYVVGLEAAKDVYVARASNNATHLAQNIRLNSALPLTEDALQTVCTLNSELDIFQRLSYDRIADLKVTLITLCRECEKSKEWGLVPVSETKSLEKVLSCFLPSVMNQENFQSQQIFKVVGDINQRLKSITEFIKVNSTLSLKSTTLKILAKEVVAQCESLEKKGTEKDAQNKWTSVINKSLEALAESLPRNIRGADTRGLGAKILLYGIFNQPIPGFRTLPLSSAQIQEGISRATGITPEIEKIESVTGEFVRCGLFVRHCKTRKGYLSLSSNFSNILGCDGSASIALGMHAYLNGIFNSVTEKSEILRNRVGLDKLKASFGDHFNKLETELKSLLGRLNTLKENLKICEQAKKYRDAYPLDRICRMPECFKSLVAEFRNSCGKPLFVAGDDIARGFNGWLIKQINRYNESISELFYKSIIIFDDIQSHAILLEMASGERALDFISQYNLFQDLPIKSNSPKGQKAFIEECLTGKFLEKLQGDLSNWKRENSSQFKTDQRLQVERGNIVTLSEPMAKKFSLWQSEQEVKPQKVNDFPFVVRALKSTKISEILDTVAILNDIEPNIITGVRDLSGELKTAISRSFHTPEEALEVVYALKSLHIYIDIRYFPLNTNCEDRITQISKELIERMGYSEMHIHSIDSKSETLEFFSELDSKFAYVPGPVRFEFSPFKKRCNVDTEQKALPVLSFNSLSGKYIFGYAPLNGNLKDMSAFYYPRRDGCYENHNVSEESITSLLCDGSKFIDNRSIQVHKWGIVAQLLDYLAETQIQYFDKCSQALDRSVILIEPSPLSTTIFKN